MLIQLFNPEDREKLERMYDEWEYFRNASGIGKLDNAFRTKDFVLLRDALKGVRGINREFTTMAVRCYTELLGEDE